MYVCVCKIVVEHLCTGSDRYMIFIIVGHGQKACSHYRLLLLLFLILSLFKNFLVFSIGLQ